MTSGAPLAGALAATDDSALPGYAVLREDKLRTQLISDLLRGWLHPQAELLESNAVLRRHVPGKRCNFQIELMILPTPGAPVERRWVVGKVYAQDQGAKVYEALHEFRKHGFAGSTFLVPQPLAYDPHWKLLLLGWSEGELLRSLVLGGSDVSHRMEEAANWLLKFHQCGVTTGRQHTFRRHLETLVSQKHRLVNVRPEWEGRLASILSRIEERGEALSGWTAGPTHYDFSPDHLVFNEAQLTVIDFDEFRQYDPMFDVAHFTAQLRLLGLRYMGDVTRFDELGEAFQKAYRVGAQDYSEARVRFYQAVAYFKMAHIVGAVVRPPAWKEAVEQFLSETERVLGRLS
jgi:aminoglycoside phosphotransferase (APT) family kinase protein